MNENGVKEKMADWTEFIPGDVINLKSNDAMPIGIALTNSDSDGTVMVSTNSMFKVNCGTIGFVPEEPKSYKVPTINMEVPKIVMD